MEESKKGKTQVTPLEKYPELAKAIGATDVYFKREDLHPYGSHKGRSIPHMIQEYYRDGNRRFALSSSGNAALAAILYIKELNVEKSGSTASGNGIHWVVDLDVFVGRRIDPHKLEKLRRAAAGDGRIRISVEERPLQALNEAVKKGARSLRQSTDDLALIGYGSLGHELAAVPHLGAIFIGTSSGTTAQALAEYFLHMSLVAPSGSSANYVDEPVIPAFMGTSKVQIHIIQTSACHPISETFNACAKEEEISLADAIVAKVALRKNALVPLIEKSGGRGWCATNDDIRTARESVKKHTKLEISPNSALSVVGLMQAVKAGHNINGAAVCIICGD